MKTKFLNKPGIWFGQKNHGQTRSTGRNSFISGVYIFSMTSNKKKIKSAVLNSLSSLTYISQSNTKKRERNIYLLWKYIMRLMCLESEKALRKMKGNTNYQFRNARGNITTDYTDIKMIIRE